MFLLIFIYHVCEPVSTFDADTRLFCLYHVCNFAEGFSPKLMANDHTRARCFFNLVQCTVYGHINMSICNKWKKQHGSGKYISLSKIMAFLCRCVAKPQSKLSEQNVLWAIIRTFALSWDLLLFCRLIFQVLYSTNFGTTEPNLCWDFIWCWHMQCRSAFYGVVHCVFQFDC